MPGFAANRALGGGGGGSPAALRAEGISTARDGTARLRMRGVTLHDATAAEIAAQAARETRSAARRSGVSPKVIREWKEGMTQEERERVIGEQKLTEEQVATLDATAHARALAEAAGDRTLTLEEEVVEINRQIEKLGEADEDEAVQMLDAELLAEEEAARAEEAARSERPKAEEAARNEGEGAPRAEVPAEAKPDAGGGEAAAGRELEALRVRAAELDERLRAKGLRKAERAKISEELSGVQARMQELSGGNLVLFSRGEAAAARPALSPTKAALRDRLLLKIARTAGIRVIREGTEQITASARNAEARMRLGGYMGSAWSARANDALERGLRPAPMVAKELGVSAEAVELHMRSPEWHHVGDDYEEVHFYDPDEAPLTDADAVEDAETARSFLRYVEMLNYDTRTFTVKPRVAGRFESEASDEAYALFTSRGTAVAKEAFEAEDEFRALVEKETASAEELRAAAKATLAAAKSGRKKMEAAAKAFLAKHKDWARERPRRARRGTNGLRYSLEEAFPATTEEREGIERAAKAKGTWLKAPNGNPSELTPEQWVTVRTRAFKEWFGDWEKAARIEKLRDSAPLVFTGEEHKGKYELTPRSAEKYILSELRGEYLNKDTGERISVTRKGAKKVLHHDVDSEAHLKSIAYIPQILENAIFVSEEPNAKAATGFDSYRYYVCGMEIGGEQYTAKVVVGKLGRETYYDHVLSPVNKDALLEGIGKIPSLLAPKKSTLFSIGDKRLLSVLQVNSSKIVDENGEPLVVYHGTDADPKFYQFSHKFSMRNGAALGRGFYFSEDKSVAEGYGNDVIPVFLNIKKPLEPAKNKITKEDLKRVIRHIDPDGDTIADYASSDRGYPGKEWYERSLDEAVDAIFSDSQISDSEILGEMFSVWGGEAALRGVVEVLGYDGFVPKNTLSDDVKIAFLPEQIKSATENVGTFDAGNPDIRYSRGGDKVLRDGEGVVYGYWDEGRGELHLNEDFADFDTPLHEWAHVWLSWVRKADARLAERALALTKETKFYKELRADEGGAYAGLSDDALAEEAFAMLCGKDGGEIMAQEGVSTWTKLRRAVLNVFKAALRTLGVSESVLSRLTFRDMQSLCLRDLLDEETFSLKELRASVSAKRALEDAATEAVIDNGIEDASRKRAIRSASIAAAGKLLMKKDRLTREQAESAETLALLEESVGRMLPTEPADVVRAAAKAAQLAAKVVYSSRAKGDAAIVDSAEAVREANRATRILRAQRVLKAANRAGQIDADLYADAREYVIAYSQAHLFWQQAFADPAFSDAIRKHHGKAVLGDLREHITHVLSAKQMSDGEGRAVDRLTSFAAVSALGANMLVMMFPPRFPRRPATRLDKRKPAFMRGF